MPTIKCKEILPDLQMGICTYEASADTEDELMEKITEHACSVHNIKNVSPDVAVKIKKATKKKAK